MLTKGNISEYKKYSLVSMMEHLGSSARSGHYVGFFKRGEKVRLLDSSGMKRMMSASEPFQLASC